MNNLFRDLKLAIRLLTKNPAFTAAAVFTLGLGIGLNTAVFSGIHSILLRPLPGVRNPHELVQVYRTWPGGFRFGSNAVPHYFDIRDRNDVFEGAAAWNIIPLSLSVEGRSERVMGQMVSANFFTVLGANAILGRTFLQEEGVGPGEHPVAVLSHSFWQSRFGSDPTVLGRSLTVNGYPFQVVGVAAPEFKGPMPVITPAMWVPLMMQQTVMPPYNRLENRGTNFMSVIARLKQEVKLEQAQSSMDVLMAQMREEYPDYYEGSGILLFPQSDAGIHPLFRSAQVGLSAVLMAVVGLLLMIACVNVANLFLARAQDRKKEMAVRLSLGARRGRLIGQLLTESLLFAFLAGGVGLLLALWAISVANGVQLPMDFEGSWDLTLSSPVLFFTLVASVAAGILFGLAPALQASRPETISALKGELSAQAVSGSRLSRGLVVVQMALSLILLISAGLFLQNLRMATTINTGFVAENLLLVSVDPGLQGYERERSLNFYGELIPQIEALPVVQAVGLAEMVPLGFGSSQNGVNIPGYEPSPNEFMAIDYNRASAGYFEAMGIRVLQGRGFAEQEDEEGARTLIVNQAFADRFWPGQNPLGKIVETSGEREVVGVVENGKYRSLGEDQLAYMYYPWPQVFSSEMTLHVRTAGDPEELVPLIREEIRKLDPDLPLYDVRTMNSHLGIALMPARLGGTLLGIFGILGLILAAVGIYSVMAYWVSQRTREIGIRVALGADGNKVAALVLGQGLRVVVIGAVLGMVAALAAGRAIHSLLYSQSGIDLVTFIGVPLVLAAVALLATYVPARRAAGVDPIEALRAE
jgi:predicted permease